MSSPPDAYAEDTREESKAVTRMVESVTHNERGVRELLGELAALKLQDRRREVRERLRTFADRNLLAFHTLMLTVNGAESFFEDLADTDVEEDTVETFEELGETYGALDDEFVYVHYEQRHGARNPWVTLRTGTRYDGDGEMPLMDSELTSRGVTLGEFCVPPSQALSMADLVVAHAGYLLGDLHDADRDLDGEELDRVRAALEELEGTLAQTREVVDAVDDGDDEVVEDIATDGGYYYFN